MRFSLPDAERRIIAWYLVHRRAAPSTSSIRDYHFNNLIWRDVWRQATGGEVPEETGIQHATFERLQALAVRPSEIPVCEDRVRRAWSVSYVRHELRRVVEDIESERLEDLPGIALRTQEIIRDAIAGGPVQYEIATAVGERALADAREAALTEKRPRLIPMPIIDMRRDLPGWLRGTLNIIGGRTSEHKTTLVRMSAGYAERNGWKTLLWTMEDSSEQIAMRDLAADNVATFGQLVAGRAGDLAGVSYLNDERAITDRRNPTLSDVESTIRAVHAKRGCDLVVLDYVQLIRPDYGRADNDYWHTATTRLSALAKDLDLVIIATSQIDKSSSQTTRNEKRIPSMHDMLYSSALCHDAHAVFMIGVLETKPRRLVRINVDKFKSAAKVGWTLPVDAAHDTIGD